MWEKRRILIAGASIAGAAVGILAVLAILPNGPGITKGNFDQIEAGMTRAQVESLLGEKGSDVTGLAKRPGSDIFAWVASEGSTAIIEFNAGAVQTTFWRPSSETFAQKLLRWLRLKK